MFMAKKQSAVSDQLSAFSRQPSDQINACFIPKLGRPLAKADR
jgi:hypothetical protein